MRLILKRIMIIKPLWISVLSLLVGALLPALSQNKTDTAEPDLSKIYAFERLRQEADKIQAELDSSNPDLVRQAESDRFDLIKELERWAEKYKIPVSQMEDIRPIQVKDGKVVISRRCEQVVEVKENICFAHYGFFDHSAYQCIYKCVPKNQTTMSAGAGPRLTIGQEQSTGKLFPAWNRNAMEVATNRVGFIDNKGKLVIPFRFYYAEEFSEGLALIKVRRDGLDGYIDTSGKIIIEPQFDSALPFKGERAQVRINNKWGYIDKSGKLVIQPIFDTARNFQEGLAAVERFGQWGYSNTAGEIIINFQFEKANDFSEGLAAVVKNGRLGYIDTLGNWVIQPQLECIEPFLAWRVPNFHQGLAVFKKGSKYGYIDSKGKVVIEPQFDEAEGFSEGLARVKIGDKVGYINKSGKLAIALSFDDALAFTEGLAAVKTKNKWGYINRSGKVVIIPQFEMVSSFSSNVARVRFDGENAYIDRTGACIWNKKCLPTLPLSANGGLNLPR
jgi:hypothetical protein